MHVCCHVWLFVTLWIVARQAPLFMDFSRQEYWSGLPFPPPRDLPHPGIKPMSITFLALSGEVFCFLFLSLHLLGSPSESEVAPSCPTLCNSMACSLPGFSVHGIFQARILEWVTISFSRRSSRSRDWIWVSRIIGRRFTVWATKEVQEAQVIPCCTLTCYYPNFSLGRLGCVLWFAY